MEFKNNKPGKYQKKSGSQGAKYTSNKSKPYDRGDNKYGDRPKPYNREENKFSKPKPYSETNNYSDKPKPYDRGDNKYGDRPKPYNREENKFSKPKPYNRETNNYSDKPKPYDRGDNKYGDRPKPYNREENKFSKPKPYNRETNNYGDKPKPYDRGDNKYGDRQKPYNREENKPGDRPQFKNFSKNNDNRFKKPSFPPKNDRTDGGQKKYIKYDNKDKKTFSKKDEFVKVNPTKFADNISEPEAKDENIVCGRNAVLELIKSGRTIDKIFIQKNNKEGSLKLIFAEALKTGITVVEAERSKLDDLNLGSNHQGVIAFASQKEYCTVEDILEIAEHKKEKPFIIIADKIMDPHNLGAIIRSAECAGAHGLIIPKRHAVGISSVVAKSSAGAVEHLEVAKVANLTNVVEELKKRGVWIFSSYSSEDEEAETKEVKDYRNVDFDLPCALILGNEGDGISPVLTEKSDFLIKIPMYGLVSSLNVSCAAAVLMFKIKENRLGAKKL